MKSVRGECYCRAVGYEVPDAFEYALVCHCNDCRRTTGAASKPFAGIRADQLKITRGQNLITRYGEAKGHNANCSKCGSLLYSLVRNGEYVHVALGTLVDVPTIRPTAHIFVASKAEWEVIGDDLPQFDAFPPR